MLGVHNERELVDWIAKLVESDLRFVLFREPDLDGELTAVAVVPNPQASRVLSSVGLAGVP